MKEEIQKQLNVGFISMVEYPEWLANVVPIPKKDGKVRVCVDFKDLNKASHKDDFPLPHIYLLVDSTVGYSLLSFMDGEDNLHYRVGYLLLQYYAIWVEECKSHLSKGCYYFIS